MIELLYSFVEGLAFVLLASIIFMMIVGVWYGFFCLVGDLFPGLVKRLLK